MRQVVQDFGTGEVRLVDVAAPAPRDRFVRVRTVASVVSRRASPPSGAIT